MEGEIEESTENDENLFDDDDDGKKEVNVKDEVQVEDDSIDLDEINGDDLLDNYDTTNEESNVKDGGNDPNVENTKENVSDQNESTEPKEDKIASDWNVKTQFSTPFEFNTNKKKKFQENYLASKVEYMKIIQVEFD
jgi:hypothetical protein